MAASSTENDYIDIPEEYTRRELNSLYRAIPLKDATFRLLRKYLSAMANLYGVIPLRKAKEIILLLSPGLVTDEEFLAFAEIARHESDDYFIIGEDEIYNNVEPVEPLDREIIEAMLFGIEDSPFETTKFRQKGKPYYVPSKTELLRYCDPFYCEDTPEKLKLFAFLKGHCKPGDSHARFAFDFILYSIRSGIREMGEVIDTLQDRGVHFDTMNEMQRFVELYSAFHNKTRMYDNRGYTPDEMMEMTPQNERFKSIEFGANMREAIKNGDIDAADLRRQILEMDVPDESMRAAFLNEIDSVMSSGKAKKVGRNDPCPCGSGKKYKKCCGR